MPRHYKFMFLPPVNDRLRRWAGALREQVPEIEILLPASREEALQRIAEVRGAFGTLDPELLAAARELTWLCAPAAGPGPGFYFPELVDSDVTVTNQRGIYSDHIAAHIMAFVLAFARACTATCPGSSRGSGNRRESPPPPCTCPRPRPSSSAPAASAARRRATWPTSACT